MRYHLTLSFHYAIVRLGGNEPQRQGYPPKALTLPSTKIMQKIEINRLYRLVAPYLAEVESALPSYKRDETSFIILQRMKTNINGFIDYVGRSRKNEIPKA